jgi:hypothetical protein
LQHTRERGYVYKNTRQADASASEALSTPGVPTDAATAQLKAAKVAYVPLQENSKKALWSRGRRTYDRPAGNVGLYPRKNLIVFDVDSDEGYWLVEEIGLQPTYTVRTRNGWHFYFLMPEGVKIKQRIKLITGVDFITTGYVVAPGSTANGHTYKVVNDVPIATLPLDIARNIADLADDVLKANARAAASPTWPGLSTPSSRRALARRARQAVTPNMSLVKRAAWLAEDRDGHRHQALWSLSLQAHGTEGTFETLCADIMASPVRSKLPAKDPEAYLKKTYWDKAAAAIGNPLTQPVARVNFRERYGAADAADHWRRQAGQGYPLRYTARDLIKLITEWVARYGKKFYLAQSTIKAWMSTSNWRVVRSAIDELIRHGLLIEFSRDGLHQAQATYFEIALEGEGVEGVPPRCTALCNDLEDGERDEAIAALLRVAEEGSVSALPAVSIPSVPSPLLEPPATAHPLTLW